MYHSLKFEIIHPKNGQSMMFDTYDDFKLVPNGRPIIQQPELKKKIIEVPGANGVIDLTESLISYPVFNNREGSIKFIVLNDILPWMEIYEKIANSIHGRRCKMFLEDDPDWYYDGRWTIGDWIHNNNGTWSNMTLAYSLYPYKLFKNKTTLSYQVSNTSEYTTVASISRNNIGWMPVSPTIVTTSSNMSIKVVNYELGNTYERTFASAGTYNDPSFILYDFSGDGLNIQAKGNGYIRLTFREGRL